VNIVHGRSYRLDQLWMLAPTGNPGTSGNIFGSLAVKCYMTDLHRKRTGRAVRKFEPRSSSNVGNQQQIAETQTNISVDRVHLTTKEAQVLQLLAANPGRIFSRNMLLKMIWGYADGVISRTVDVHIQRLRKKLKGNPAPTIHTIFGRGYVLEHPGHPDVTI
jgi:two-component system, OmpR family, response regulator VicR